MADKEKLRFSRINVEGYRGRNFKLEMNSQDDHSVFVMGGNTGKTTLIELLRWCFKYSQSNAEGQFRHMFTSPAHVLDWDYPDEEQKCKIEIYFSKNGHEYLFRRTTEGRYSKEKAEKEGEGENEISEYTADEISKIEDILEVDRGSEVYRGEEAHRKLVDLEISPSADFSLFDGEKAREFMLYASDRSKVQELVDTVEERVTPSFIFEYLQKLNELESRTYDEISSKASDRGIQRTANKAKRLRQEISADEASKNTLKTDLEGITRTKKQIKDRIEELNNEIAGTKSEKLEEKLKIRNEIEDDLDEIDKGRGTLYSRFLEVSFPNSSKEPINEMKSRIRERGNLPEPYRKDLINLCLNEKEGPPKCYICGTELNEEKKKRVKQLGQQVAPHNVQDFLSQDINYEMGGFNEIKKFEHVEQKLGDVSEKIKKLKRVELSTKEEDLVKKRDRLVARKEEIDKKIGDLEGELNAAKTAIEEKRNELSSIEEKLRLKKEYRKVFDEIEEAKETIRKTKNKIKEKAIKVISDALDSSVKSILGPDFGARLTEDEGLMLGENGVFNREVGGMTAKLILSYCFAESMTKIDPLMVDTPVGNIDHETRENLADHLDTNHDQIILLCLPTELDSFAPKLTERKEKVQNKGEKASWLV